MKTLRVIGPPRVRVHLNQRDAAGIKLKAVENLLRTIDPTVLTSEERERLSSVFAVGARAFEPRPPVLH
jgi:hypothetical protein